MGRFPTTTTTHRSSSTTLSTANTISGRRNDDATSADDADQDGAILSGDHNLIEEAGNFSTEGARAAGGGIIASYAYPQSEPASSPIVESGEAHTDVIMVSTDNNNRQPDIDPPGTPVSILDSIIDSINDSIKVDFETELRGIIVWLAAFAWPTILVSFLVNIVLFLCLLIFCCGCCMNRRKCRKLKRKMYTRVPTLLSSSSKTIKVKDQQIQVSL